MVFNFGHFILVFLDLVPLNFDSHLRIMDALLDLVNFGFVL